MFSGIVEETGLVSKLDKKNNLSVLNVAANKTIRGTKKGDSVAVNGVCLTVTNVRGKIFTFDIMQETIKATTLNQIKPKSKVNLERALKMSDRNSGHFVTGHIDAVGKIKNRIDKENYTELQIELNKSLMKYIVSKGSVCLDGVSLTVASVKGAVFSVHLIPLTKNVTTLSLKQKNDSINVETDILAKYILNRK